MQADPSGSPEAVADDVMYRHISRKAGAVVDVGRLSVRRVRTTYIVVIATQHNRPIQLTCLNGFVESLCYSHTAFRICIQNTRLGAHNWYIGGSIDNPVDVVVELCPNIITGGLQHLPQYPGGNLVRQVKVFLTPRTTNPTEGAKAIVKTHRPHDIFYIAGIAIATFRCISPYIGPCNTRLFEKGVAVVPKVHAFGTKDIDGCHMPAKCRPHFFHEKDLIADEQLFGLRKAIALRTVAKVVNVVQRCLVTPQLHGYALLQQSLPKIHNIALVNQ